MSNLELHVIFGTGPVGQAVARELVKRGKPVKMINRSGKRPGGVPEGVPVVAGDVFDAALAKELAQGATHVYQCTNPPYHAWVEKFPTLQANTLEAAAAAGAKYIVMDNVYLYGDPNGQPIREDMPYNAHNKKGSLRARMAKDVLAAHAIRQSPRDDCTGLRLLRAGRAEFGGRRSDVWFCRRRQGG